MLFCRIWNILKHHALWQTIGIWLEDNFTFLGPWWCGISLFCKIMFPFVTVLFWTVSLTRFEISLYHGEKLFYKKCYSTSSHIYLFHNSGSSTLTLAGASICYFTPPFSHTKMSVQISPVCGGNSNWNI